MKYSIILIFILTIPFCAISQQRQIQQKSIGITVSLPWINNYSYYDYVKKHSSSKSGFTGLGASFFYRRENHKFSLSLGLTGDLPAPIGAFDYGKEGTRTNIVSAYSELTYNRKIFGKLNLVTGVNWIRYRFDFTSYVDTLPSYKVFDKTLGLTVGSEYSFSKYFSVALLYRPAIISFDLKKYRHLVSLDARFDINVWRKK